MKITQIKSVIGAKPNIKETVRSLGLKHIGDYVEIPDTQQNRGYVRTVRHLVKVEEK
ncbi:MAG: 50S ribosomal protein L30 [Bifidobacteriaceae bacterium]|nr:50S ribosomal protein L30 [Bifidobacteriaceae bacterium]